MAPAGRLVQQQGGRFDRFRAGARQQLHTLVEHLELWLLDHFAVDADPAALDVQLGFAARAGGEFGEAFGQADRVGHGEATGMKDRQFTRCGDGRRGMIRRPLGPNLRNRRGDPHAVTPDRWPGMGPGRGWQRRPVQRQWRQGPSAPGRHGRRLRAYCLVMAMLVRGQLRRRQARAWSRSTVAVATGA